MPRTLAAGFLHVILLPLESMQQIIGRLALASNACKIATAVADALRDRLEIICDGGIRRGTHVVKALALGANACSIGRTYLFGLAAGGQAGVERSLDLLRSEVERTMALMGCNAISKIGRSYLRKRG